MIDLSEEDWCPLRVELVKTFGRHLNTSTWEPTNEQLYEVGDQAWLYIDESSALVGGGGKRMKMITLISKPY